MPPSSLYSVCGAQRRRPVHPDESLRDAERESQSPRSRNAGYVYVTDKGPATAYQQLVERHVLVG